MSNPIETLMQIGTISTYIGANPHGLPTASLDKVGALLHEPQSWNLILAFARSDGTGDGPAGTNFLPHWDTNTLTPGELCTTHMCAIWRLCMCLISAAHLIIYSHGVTALCPSSHVRRPPPQSITQTAEPAQMLPLAAMCTCAQAADNNFKNVKTTVKTS